MGIGAQNLTAFFQGKVLGKRFICTAINIKSMYCPEQIILFKTTFAE